MKNKTSFICLLLVLFFTEGFSQEIETLRQKIDSILSTKDAVVGVAINGVKKEDTLSVNGKKHFPM